MMKIAAAAISILQISLPVENIKFVRLVNTTRCDAQRMTTICLLETNTNRCSKVASFFLKRTKFQIETQACWFYES